MHHSFMISVLPTSGVDIGFYGFGILPKPDSPDYTGMLRRRTDWTAFWSKLCSEHSDVDVIADVDEISATRTLRQGPEDTRGY